MPHRLMHLAPIAKAHFDLGRMHVHIHPRRLDLHVQHIHRLAVAVQHVFVGRSRRVGDDFVADEALVDVGKLLVGAAAGVVGDACAASHADAVLSMVDLDGLGDEIVTENVFQPLITLSLSSFTLRRPPLLHQLAIMPNRKTHFWPHQRMAAHGFDAVRQLGGVGFEELAPRGGAEKQLFDLNRCALCAGGGAEFAGQTAQ